MMLLGMEVGAVVTIAVLLVFGAITQKGAKEVREQEKHNRA